MDEKAIISFKEKLDDQHDWPGVYTFKFIVPADKVEQVKAFFKEEEMEQKASSNGKYISITARVLMQASDDVIATYIEAKKIEGIISL